MPDAPRSPALERLDVLVGEWTVTPDFPDAQRESEMNGKLWFEWDLDRQFLVQRSNAPDPIPDSLSIISVSASSDGSNDDAYLQHYFDSRGVVRVYRMTFDGTTWTLERDQPDFSPFEFAQRYTGTLEDGGSTIRGTWEISHDGRTWEKDFDLTYARVV